MQNLEFVYQSFTREGKVSILGKVSCDCTAICESRTWSEENRNHSCLVLAEAINSCTMVKSTAGTSPPGGILEVAPPRFITTHKRSFSSRSLDTITEDTLSNEKNSPSTSISKQETDQYVPQLTNTVRTTKLSILHKEGQEPMADRQQQQASGLSAELRRIAQTQ